MGICKRSDGSGALIGPEARTPPREAGPGVRPYKGVRAAPSLAVEAGPAVRGRSAGNPSSPRRWLHSRLPGYRRAAGGGNRGPRPACIHRGATQGCARGPTGGVPIGYPRVGRVKLFASRFGSKPAPLAARTHRLWEAKGGERPAARPPPAPPPVGDQPGEAVGPPRRWPRSWRWAPSCPAARWPSST